MIDTKSFFDTFSITLTNMLSFMRPAEYTYLHDVIQRLKAYCIGLKLRSHSL